MPRPKPQLISSTDDHQIWVEYHKEGHTKTIITLTGQAIKEVTGNNAFTFGLGYHVRKRMIEALLDHLEYDEEGW